MRNFDSSKDLNEIISLYLDKQLSREEEEDFTHRMKQDEQVKRIVEEEKGFRNFIKTNLKRHEVPDKVKTNVMNLFKPFED